MAQSEFAQSYNKRKQRSGADWVDRFHSTTIQSGQHLVECMTYIALNMVRCGVVQHPREWDWCGYHELMGFRKRFRVLDITTLLSLLACDDISDFRRQYEIDNDLRNFLDANNLFRSDPRDETFPPVPVSLFVAWHGWDIRRSFKKRCEVLPFGTQRTLPKVIDGQKSAQFFCGGGGKQLVKSHTFFSRALAELPGETLRNLDGQGAHVSFSISLRKSDGGTAETPHRSVPRKSRRL